MVDIWGIGIHDKCIKMKFKFLILALVPLILLSGTSPAFSQEQKNPSLIIDNLEIPWYEFNKVGRDAEIVNLEKEHSTSWQVTIDNNLAYANENGNGVLRIYDTGIEDKFIEVGMGAQSDHKFWVAVQLPDEGYVVVHNKLDRGWLPSAKVVVSFTNTAGLTVNNGERIVVTNLDIGTFAIGSYSIFGMESSTDPPATNSGFMTIEILSGDPTESSLHLFPFYVTAAVGLLAGILFLTKKRSK